MSIRESFFEVCRDAVPARSAYVSLYVNVPFYGGPEEGGWWGNDTMLVAYYPAPSLDVAEEMFDRIKQYAKELNDDEQMRHGEHCLRECEWLDARGLEPDFLPEVDGPSSYWVNIEETLGAAAHRGERQYS